MHLERIDPLRLDGATADRLAGVMNAAAGAVGQRIGPMTGEGVVAQAKFSHDDRPYDAMWLVRDTGGEVVATAWVDLPRWDNEHLALVFCIVHPDAWGRGIGTAFLDAQVSFARHQGRTMLLTFCLRDRPGHALLTSYGFEVGQAQAQRRLYPRELDYDRIQTLADDAAGKAGDYELVRLDGPAPEDWLDELVALYESINDAPNDDIEIAPDVFSVERIRQYESAMAHRQNHLYRLMARHRETGDWAGHTILCVDELRPGVAMQEDTTVVVRHRGHRLGMWLKATMLLWMRDLGVDLETIDTWNAESNTHMIAVNDELGCVVNARGLALQYHL